MQGPEVDDLHLHLILSWTLDMRDYIDCPPVLIPLLLVRNGTSEFHLSTWTLKIKTKFPSPPLHTDVAG